MKKVTLLFFLASICSWHIARADHITGGEMYYTLVSVSANNYTYAVTLKLYMRCNSGRQFNNPTIVSVFDKITGARVMDMSVGLTAQENISLPLYSNPCIADPPQVCYDVGYYQFSVTLPGSAHGYLLASQVNYRIAGINNLAVGYGLIGATYTAEIPGATPTSSGPANNGAHFVGSDLVVVCANNPFTYSFAAQDADVDQLRYSFCNAYVSSNDATVGAPATPPYSSVPYGPDYSGSTPLGNSVQIDENTGLITGIAPQEGVYVVTVCVEEIRNDVVIATQRKDLQIFIAPCSIAAAVLQPEYMLCRDSRTINLSNQSTSPLIHSSHWQILDASGVVLFTSSSTSISYTFSDTGTYKVKLQINQEEQCSDSTTALIRVYPGFIPDFDFKGICYHKPTLFEDRTTTVYGAVNSWKWNFDEPSDVNAFSTLQNPAYAYSVLGTKHVRLVVTNTKGCRDTVIKDVAIVDKPPINLAFRDTLICTGDALQLQASGQGLFSWTPNLHITAANTPTPTVDPVNTTTYYVSLDDNGCRNNDSVRVRVVDHVTLQAMADTLICRGDTIQMRVVSDGLHYSWTPAAQFLDATKANAFCFNPVNTAYEVTAVIGSCSATAQVQVNTVPYPVARAGADTIICYGTIAQLHGASDGTSFSWTPAGSLSNSTSLNTLAHPGITTNYILYCYNTLGCPKPGKDTVLVTVRPRIMASAGRDTSVLVNQPLHLLATGGVAYTWSPGTFLSNTYIPDPVANFDPETEQFHYTVQVYDEAHCVDTASVTIKVFKTLPSVFVPSAFTPNNDGLNDLVRPIAVGMQKINYFSIYNRWGQMVFTTNVNGKGWDGRINGHEQAGETFVWIVSAVDYRGQPYFDKGTVTLVR